jgi:hypothetical protein
MSGRKTIAAITATVATVAVVAVVHTLSNSGPNNAAVAVVGQPPPTQAAPASQPAALTATTAATTQPVATSQPGNPIFPGFRGIKWGTDMTLRSDMQFARDEFETLSTPMATGAPVFDRIIKKNYRRTGDELSFGTVALKDVRYVAIDDKFFSVEIESKSSFDQMLSAFIESYGQPKTENLSGYWWEGTDRDGNYFTIELAQSGGQIRATITDATLKRQLVELHGRLAEAKAALRRGQ